MRTALIALFAVVGFGTGVAVADELKAPACETKMRGVMWNFGSDQSPDIRRCDGISYVPYGFASVSKGVLPASAGRSCSDTCTAQMHSCEASCGFIGFDPTCGKRCERAQLQCENKCQ